MIYIWTTPYNYPEKLVGEYDREASPDRFIFKEARHLAINEAGCPVIKFNAAKRKLREMDDLANSAQIPVVSKKISEKLLEAASSDVQLIESKILTKDGRIDDYKIVNAVHHVDAIDHQKSRYTYITGTKDILRFEKLVLNNDCLGNHMIARISEYKSCLIINQELHDLFMVEKLNGVALYRPDELSL